LPRGREAKWLNNNIPLADVTSYLEPYPAELMNAYPIAKDIKNPKADGRHLIDPIGQRIEREHNIESKPILELNEIWQYKGRV
jgi:hypothetical protein